ncbi:hypothetical protein MAR_009338, partial [Mya arenaria]
MQGYFTFLVALWAPIMVMCSDIDACPMYGCRPSGTFSMTCDVPRDNVTVGWVADFFIGPVPDFGGCAADDAVLVCQSNGPGPADVGYMVLDKTSGALLWRDPILKFPTLPLIGIGGGFWGTDGGNLVLYDQNGKLLLPQIQLDPNMRPLFGAQYVDAGDGLILLVSEGGQIATWLTGTVERSNGTFLPVAPAVTNGNRVYILTEFKPDDSRDEANLGLQRLYAIDMLLSMDDRTHIAWSATFEKERVSARGASKLRFRPKMTAQRLYRKLHDPAVLKPSILWDAAISTVYVSLPPPMLPGVMGNGIDMLYAIKDTGNDTELVFKTAHTATNMVLFDTSGPVGNAADQLWISLSDGKLLAIEKSGVVGK